MLLVEAEFLIDDRMSEELINMPKDQKIAKQLETIKKCLGIEDHTEEFNMFLEELIKKCRVKSAAEDI